MAFWSKKPKIHTNAPAHWPKVEWDWMGVESMDTFMLGAQLTALNSSPNWRVSPVHDFVYEDGILRVPILVEEGDRKTAVFLYTDEEKDAAAHYSGVRALLRSRENAGAVYYAPRALSPDKPANVLQPIDTFFFRKPNELDKDADFALWWATEEKPKLAGSEELTSIDRWFEATDGFGFVLLTALLKDLDLVQDKEGAYALPDQPLLQPLQGPGETRMLLHASAREGLFFAFDERTPPGRRRILLRLLADFAVQFRRAIEAKGLRPHEKEKGLGLGCWRAMRDAALVQEASGTGLKVHVVEVRDGQPRRDPAATTAEHRASRPRGPGREELDFGMDLVDRVVARLKDKSVAGSTQKELGQPNFESIIAVKVGADVYERRIPLEDLPVVHSAAGRVLDEWPEAEIVAVIGDAAIRENGQRVDVFDVKVENRRAGQAGALFQRYRVARGGALELIGAPTATSTERFLLEGGPETEPAPDEELVALARRVLGEIVAAQTFSEPSGMLGDDPDGPIVLPSALVGMATGEQITVRFALQGPITAAMSCYETMQQKRPEWVVFHIDDFVSKNGEPDRRLRLCVQRKQDPGMAIFDQHYEPPAKGKPFAARGGLVFKRWGGAMLPPSA